jgi:hypothetical protein
MRRLTLLAALAVLLVGAGCDIIGTLDKPTVVATAISGGGTLRLAWTAVLDATGYEIKAGDSTWTTTALSYDVSYPAAEVKVYATNGDTKSDATTIDCRVEETTGFEVYGISDPDTTHRSAFGFDAANGTPVSYSITTGNYPSIDFYIEDEQMTLGLVNSGVGGRQWNAKGNASKDPGITAYDDLDIADATATGYSTQTEMANGGLYCLWLDPTNDGWSATDDHFAKAKVTAVQGAKVTFTIGYQKIAGLRWLVN